VSPQANKKVSRESPGVTFGSQSSFGCATAGQFLAGYGYGEGQGIIVRQTSQNPPKYLVKLLFSFRGVSEVEVPEDRILAA